MRGPGDLSGGERGVLGGAAGAGVAAVGELTVGLDKAAAMAGGVLRGIFGGLPWESGTDVSNSTASTIVVDVSNSEAAALAVDVLAVIA